MRSLIHPSARSARVSNNLSRRFLSRQLARRNNILVLTFCLLVGLALLNSFSSAANTPRSWLPFSEAQSLDQKLATQFPTLAASLALSPFEFEKTTRSIHGREVTGLTARAAKAKGPGDALGINVAQKPAEQEALRLVGERDVARSEFRAFFPEQYTESFAVEGAGVSAVLRPMNALSSTATIENGKVIYRDAYRETDSLHLLGASRSEEFLYLHSKNAPRRFEYQLSSIQGAREVTLENGAIRFKGESGRELQIEAPWVVDASGVRREDVVRWELGAAAEDGKRLLSLVLVEGADLFYPLVIDPSWSTTGSLATARYHHSATLLSNGKVLVAGGFSSSLVARLASAELYDPATGTWASTGTLTNLRDSHTATLLPNGKVLVAGGYNDNSRDLAGAELYDPATGTWAATGALTVARSAHTAILLPNGKVLVAGGNSGVAGPTLSAELYDPASGTWALTNPLGAARAFHTATLLPNGKVLVAAGRFGGALASAELYDPATGAWTATNPLAVARYSHSATLLPNGKVLVAGGAGSGISVELYDPATGAWTATGGLIGDRYGHIATPVAERESARSRWIYIGFQHCYLNRRVV